MEYRKIGGTIAARLEIGEKIVASVKEICEKENVRSAVVHAIGAVSSARTAMFDFEKGEYNENELNQFMELISLEGNVTRMNGEVYVHLHAAFGDENGNVLGGHLMEAVIGATCELFIIPLSEEIKRIHNDETGLNIFSLGV